MTIHSDHWHKLDQHFSQLVQPDHIHVPWKIQVQGQSQGHRSITHKIVYNRVIEIDFFLESIWPKIPNLEVQPWKYQGQAHKNNCWPVAFKTV